MRAAVFLLGWVLLCSGPAFAEKVRYVMDGDTFILENNQRVRMIGINAPEISHVKYGKKGQLFGSQAKRHLKDLIEKRDVRLAGGPEPFDRFGRRLAFVYLEDGTFVNRRMIEDGYAESMRKFPHPYREEFLALEKAARGANRGMWSGIQPPWWETFFDQDFWENIQQWLRSAARGMG